MIKYMRTKKGEVRDMIFALSAVYIPFTCNILIMLSMSQRFMSYTGKNYRCHKEREQNFSPIFGVQKFFRNFNCNSPSLLSLRE